MRIKELKEAPQIKGGQRPGEESPIPMKPGFKPNRLTPAELAQRMDDEGEKARENPFKKPYKPNRPTNLPPGVTVKETDYDDPKFNPRIERARIVNLKLELADADANRREEIAKEIKQIEAQLRLYQATQPEQTAPVKDKRSDDGTPYTMYFDGEVSGRMLDTDLQGAKNTGKHTVMRQLAHSFVIVTDNQGEVVFVWYPGGHQRPYEVGDKYNAPGGGTAYDDRPRYPAGHPHAGAPMPANVPITTDWSKLPDGGIEAWMKSGEKEEEESDKEGESVNNIKRLAGLK